MSKDIRKMIPSCINALVFDRISTKQCYVDLWNYELVLCECSISENVSQTDSRTLLLSILCRKTTL